MRVSKGTCSHYPMLTLALQHSAGDILELGTGLFSSSFLHWMAIYYGRKLVSYENDPHFMKSTSWLNCDGHEINFIEDWDKAPIEKEWGLVFVDHHPALRRAVEAIRVAQWAQIVVVHDTEPKHEYRFEYARMEGQFRYSYRYERAWPNTSVFSNFDDLRWLNG